MEAGHLTELIQLEDSYWWHVAKRRLATRLLQEHFPPPGLVVEGGVGSSRNLLAFQELGYEVAGLDVMEPAVEHAHERGLENVHLHDLTEPWPLADESASAVVLLDVLEHLSDPVAALQHAWQALKPGGGVIATVPAYQWLFGEWDERLGHYRRYTRRRLREEAEAAGFTVRFLSHWNAFTLLPAIAVRTYERLLPRSRKAVFPRVSSLTNRALLACADWERCWMSACPTPCGLSVVGVLQK
ncbi:class I SAM-dependent methyltransferase [Lignipirellula cremea]|uniref:Putative S-adenosylmethionine-dependent methyltransferase/MSMEI_2290 n=1 Tax=Lignipirellula cremea TaxID=2528010 RepID=A0A518DPW5_9BACT|nr:class I SAM-dependent methyltransferase [Lignipirellula cremea]QDU93886.1 putative S-adenosylmethionine-dependent methyltransferase/MSMEI_2290 [Lignipirellula cremea]